MSIASVEGGFVVPLFLPSSLTKLFFSFHFYLVFNLTEGIDVADCESKLTRHAAQNASSIAAHASVAAERARLAEKAEKAERAAEAAKDGGEGEQPETTAAAAAAAALPPPIFNQPPPLPLCLPTEPLAASADAAMSDSATAAAAGIETETAAAAPFAASGSAPKTPLDYLQMGAASGWDARLPRRKGIAEAFKSLFAF